MKDKIEKLDKYLNDELTPEEKKAMESALEEDEELARQLKELLIARMAVKESADERMKNMLRGMEGEHSMKWHTLYRTVAVAASIVLLVGLVLLMVQQFSGRYTSEELYLAYYSPPDIERMVERSLSAENRWSQALTLFSEGNYQEATVPLQALVNDSTIAARSKYYLALGACYMELKEYARAALMFNRVDRESTLSFEAQWDMALCYVMLDEKEKALGILDSITETENHPKINEAKKLKRKVRKLSD